MTNREKYEKAFVNAFGVDISKVSDSKYEVTEGWDSVGHMNLIAEIEDAFDLMMETDDIIELNSYEKGIEILRKYSIVI